jgi:hypothetical protein
MTGFTHKLTLFSVVVLLSLSAIHAQEAKPKPLHPGDVLKFELTFSGPDADKIKNASLSVYFGGPIPANQAGFGNGFGGRGNLTSPHTFRVELTIPDSIATGDYVVNRIDASPENGVGSATYTSGFGTFTYHIENPKTFTAPTVTVKPLP